MDFSNKRILITGGAGYIGSHVALALQDTGATVTIVDNLSTGFKANIQYGNLIELDLADTDGLAKVIATTSPHAIVHFAGSIVVPESVQNPIKYYQNNTQRSLGLMALAVQASVPHMIFSSTAAVYGIPSTGVCSETDALAPINPYGQSKLMTEHMLRDISAASDLSYVALRYFNVAGAHPSYQLGQRMPDATHLIKIIAQVITKKRDHLTIFGSDYPTPDGTCIRDYIHVCDLAHAHVLALQYLLNGSPSTVFNCGYSAGYSVNEVVTMAQSLFGDFKVVMGDRRDGDPPQLIANADRICNDLGFSPQYNDLKTILRSAVEFERLV
jgi:UDP-glucose 4-epimerase